MAKHIKMMILSQCPHCIKAKSLIEELRNEYKEFEHIQIEVIDEELEEEKTIEYEYWYVPTFFVDDMKLHEGVVTKEKVEAVLRASL